MALKNIGTIAILDSAGSSFDHGAFDPKTCRIFVIDPRTDESYKFITAPGAHMTAIVPPDRLYVFAPRLGCARSFR